MKIYYPSILYKGNDPILWEVDATDQARCLYKTTGDMPCDIDETNQYLRTVRGITWVENFAIISKQAQSEIKSKVWQPNRFFHKNPKLKKILTLNYNDLTDANTTPTAWADTGSWDTVLPNKNTEKENFHLPFLSHTSLINQHRKEQLLESNPFRNAIQLTLIRIFNDYIAPYPKLPITRAIFNYYQGVIRDVLTAAHVHINEEFCLALYHAERIYLESPCAPETTLHTKFSQDLMRKSLFKVGITSCLKHFQFLIQEDFQVEQLTTQQEVQIFLLLFRGQLDETKKTQLAEQIIGLTTELTTYFEIIYDSVSKLMKLKSDLATQTYQAEGYQSFYNWLKTNKQNQENIPYFIAKSIKTIHECLIEMNMKSHGLLHEDKDFFISDTFAKQLPIVDLKRTKNEKSFFQSFSKVLFSGLAEAPSSPRPR